MFKINSKFTKDIFHETDSFSKGYVGIEKESLRINESKISKNTHQKSLGSSLFNKYITTDFSEAQIEVITPPLAGKKATLKFLEDIHHFIHCNIGEEILWPLSMPPEIKEEKDIPIADYGSSNLGKLKYLYRNGLSNRYGRMMQIISGVHFNYSLPENIWKEKNFNTSIKELDILRSDLYFSTLRNIKRYNWLIIYLFGASPIIPKSLLPKQSQGFKKTSSSNYYLKYATSLRMSDLGYVNPFQENISVSLNSMDEYISDLHNATKLSSDKFKLIPSKVDGEMSQINGNILQLEDEYYSEARPKNDSINDLRMISKIKKNGVNYIELRSLDLNPFSRNGIDQDTIYFMELFSLYCFFKESPKIDNSEESEIRANNLLVAREGRSKNIMLTKSGKKISLKSLAKSILNEISLISEKLDLSDNCYKYSLNSAEIKIGFR